MTEHEITLHGAVTSVKVTKGQRTQFVIKVENSLVNNLALVRLQEGDNGVLVCGPVDKPTVSGDDPNQTEIPDPDGGEFPGEG